MTVFDMHGHLWSQYMGERRYMSDEAKEKWFDRAFLGSEPVLDATGDKLIRAMDRFEEATSDAYRMVVFAIDIGSMFSMDVSIAGLNDWVSEEASKDNRGRIIPFACIDPTRPNAIEETRRCVTDLGVRGFKLYPPTGFYPNDERVLPFYEEVISLQETTGRSLPVLLHQGFSFSGSKYAQPIYLEEIAFRYKPKLKLILAHAGIPWVDEALSIAVLHENVYLDIALFGDLYGFWPELHLKLFGKAKRAGVLGRILFGSDWPLCSAWIPAQRGNPSWMNLQNVATALRDLKMNDTLLDLGYPEITAADIDGVLGRNAVSVWE
jgi:predicted TIM-barrel fold metal-dependent hydrolase